MEQYCTPCINHGLIGIKFNKNKKIPMSELIDKACLFLDTNKVIIMGKDRRRMIAEKRHMIMSYLSRERKFNLTHIGRGLNRDHTTVIYAVGHVDNLCATDWDFKQQYTALTNHLNNL